MEEKIRCGWCGNEEIYVKYHDEEWGVPVHSDQKLFEHLMMESMQCGLNWLMMLRKREIFRGCFAGFDYERIAAFDGPQVERILGTEGMIRSRRKIEAIINNAQKYIKVREQFGSFDTYLWRYTEGRTLVYRSHMKGEGCAENQPGYEKAGLQVRGPGDNLFPSPGLRPD